MNEPRSSVPETGEAAPVASEEHLEPQPIFSELVPFLANLWRRKWIILAVLATTLFVAVLYLLKATPIYRSEAELLVERTGPNILEKDIFSSTMGLRNFLGTQSEILQSARIVDLALKQQDLMALPTIRRVRRGDPEANIVEAIRGDLSVKLKRDTNVLTVSYESPYPEDAAAIANGILQAYLLYHREQTQTTSGEVLKTLTQQHGKLDSSLKEAEDALFRFVDEKQVTYFTEEGFDAILQHLSALRASLTQAELDMVTASLRHAQLDAVRDDPKRVWEFIESEDIWARQFAGSPSVIEARRLRQQLSEARAQLALLGGGEGTGAGLPALQGFSQRYQEAERALLEAKLRLRSLSEQELGERHPLLADARAKVQELEAERRRALEEERLVLERNIGALQREYARAEKELAETLVSAAANDLALRQRKEERLNELLGRETQNTRALRREAMEYDRYKDKVDRTKNLLAVIANRIKELELTRDYGRVTVRILRDADVPEGPVKPRKALVLALAMVLGLMLGAFAASLVEHFDVRVRDPEEVGQYLGAPMLGVVPAVHPEGGELERLRAVGLAAWKAPTSQLAESYRRVRTAIDFGAAPEHTRKILVTSPIPGDGKTTLASNLAASMALNGKRVLLIDADLRWPRLNKVFGVYRKEGLTDVLVGEARLEEAVFQTEIPNLDVLPCGTRPPNPAELLGSGAFTDLVRRLESAYDRILFDSAPLMAVADAQILAAVADQTVVVTRFRQAERPLFVKVRKMLAGVGRQPMGVVVNVVEARRRGYYGGYYYGKYGHGRYYRRYYGKYGEEELGEYGVVEPEERSGDGAGTRGRGREADGPSGAG